MGRVYLTNKQKAVLVHIALGPSQPTIWRRPAASDFPFSPSLSEFKVLESLYGKLFREKRQVQMHFIISSLVYWMNLLICMVGIVSVMTVLILYWKRGEGDAIRRKAKFQVVLNLAIGGVRHTYSFTLSIQRA